MIVDCAGEGLADESFENDETSTVFSVPPLWFDETVSAVMRVVVYSS